jgi:DNA polymerase III epsilon subunit-like protein
LGALAFPSVGSSLEALADRAGAAHVFVTHKRHRALGDALAALYVVERAVERLVGMGRLPNPTLREVWGLQEGAIARGEVSMHSGECGAWEHVLENARYSPLRGRWVIRGGSK